MVKNQKKKVKQTAVKKVKKAPVKPLDESIEKASGEQSLGYFIFKVIVWVLTILFFGTEIICIAKLSDVKMITNNATHTQRRGYCGPPIGSTVVEDEMGHSEWYWGVEKEK